MHPRATSPLDDAVFPARAALRERGALAPVALFSAATGLGLLTGRLSRAGRLPLEGVEGVPEAWRGALLHWGELHGLPVWLLEDEPEPCLDLDRRPWTRAFPVWLAAAAGASALVQTSAACALSQLELGTLALASDHLHLGGPSPLTGLGDSRLGPMFPDQSRLHDPHLRADALEQCARLGLHGCEAVFACTASPALETPAEQAWYRAAGADVSVQGLAPTLLAAAHAGLGTLAVGVVVARAGARLDIAGIAAAARRLAPALDDLLSDLAAAAGARASAALDEAQP